MRIHCRYDPQFKLYMLGVGQGVAVLDEDEFLAFLTQLQLLLVYWTSLTPQEVRLMLMLPGQ